MILSKEDKFFFDENGYILLKNVIPIVSIDQLMEEFAEIVRVDMSLKNETELLKLDPLQDGLIELKKRYPHCSAWIHAAINNSLSYKRFIYNLPIDDYISELMPIGKKKMIGTSIAAFRYDIPGHTEINRDWHQDFTYVPDSEDSLASWLPLNNVTKENGALRVCKESHKNGHYKTTFQPSDQYKSEQYVVSQEIVDQFSQEILEAEKGDIAFFHMDMLHRSGENLSNHIRYSSQYRFVNIEAPDYRPVRFSRMYDEFDRHG
jgi:hypothetical protein